MNRYQNLGGDSGVIAYEIGDDFIEVQFKDGWIYLYTYMSTGRGDVETMKRLAAAGQGLNSFISTTVKKRFASKRR